MKGKVYDIVDALNEAKNPITGKANGYIGTIKIEATSASKDIPKSLYKYIRNIIVETPTWRDKPNYFEVKSGEILVTYKTPYIKVEYTDIEPEELAEKFRDLGWKVE